MSLFGKLNRVIWVDANGHDLGLQLKRIEVFWFQILQCPNSTHLTPEANSNLCASSTVFYTTPRPIWAVSTFASTAAQQEPVCSVDSWCWESSHCRICILWIYITASQSGPTDQMLQHVSLPGVVPEHSFWFHFLQKKPDWAPWEHSAMQSEYSEWGWVGDTVQELLNQIKTFMHILLAASNQAIQTSCTMSRELPGEAENIRVC